MTLVSSDRLDDANALTKLQVFFSQLNSREEDLEELLDCNKLITIPAPDPLYLNDSAPVLDRALVLLSDFCIVLRITPVLEALLRIALPLVGILFCCLSSVLWVTTS